MSIQDIFKNGSTVSRWWNDDATEMLGVFQYETDAKNFALFKINQDADKDYKARKYIVHCTHSGKCTILGPQHVKE